MIDKTEIIIPTDFNYLAAFLTLGCNLRCSYCINRFGDLSKRRQLAGKEWIDGLNRIQTRPDLPISLQGGEPTLHPDFYEIVNGLRKDLPLDLLTNLQFNIREFIDNVPPDRFKRDAKYASIRVSYHPGQMNFEKTLEDVETLSLSGYSVGVWEIDHPSHPFEPRERQKLARGRGIDYRLKEFLGIWKGVMYGTYRWIGAIGGDLPRSCSCKTSELLIAPDGWVHRCHSDLYSGLHPIGDIMEGGKRWGLGEWKGCMRFGHCNPCDVKIKTNRFQEFGHSSVDIKDITPLPSDPQVK